MSTANMTTADTKLRDTVLWQLEWDQEVDASGIGVTARVSTVTLTGYVDTYAGKLAAERAAKQVRGVRAVANEIEVRPRVGRTDTDIADDIVHALRIHANVPAAVQAAVHHGCVTLTGQVHRSFEKEAAEAAVHHVRGVRHVANYIKLAPQDVARDAMKRVARALHQHALLDSRRLEVEVIGHVATITGIAGSVLQREAAERAVAQTPGVTDVDNRVIVAGVVPEGDDPDEVC